MSARLLRKFLKSPYSRLGNNHLTALHRLYVWEYKIRLVNAQIRGIDPTAIPFKRRKRETRTGRKVSLDSNAAYRRDTLMSELIGVCDTCDHSPAVPVVSWMKEAVSLLKPRNAQAIDLYYNKGYSWRKAGEVMGCTESCARQLAMRGLKYIHHWVKVRTLVHECAAASPFNWDKLLDKIDLFERRQLDILLTLLDSSPSEYTSYGAFAKYIGIRRDNVPKCIRSLKGVCWTIGIPKEEIDSIHPLVKRVSYPAKKPNLICRLCKTAKLGNWVKKNAPA